ncbi:putative sterol-4-alpha-carboxylate 3-dehydrogenase, decarboxylating [Mytilinidion resinicola]|uniref:Sterol-4-alpha-carboxylate 3-dehydrogenase, decarboxylating n=1 Tax=Mytilinidion resinicola TaxID=574789 RepID=A0A6A6XZX2_9PEZI|nr:putative sterol-4-alpha-carboxylate 3-dehydrogenase, decarboxylating [Mytilinidion resinicola]KAF2802072.1 putative sterol-4-alpha-carboxylate 3-dehydrogenase, decarboxylating [Mytilinidion resinicola]
MSSKQSITSALVIGGCGNLGHNVVKQLLKLEPQPKVSVFDLRTTQNRQPGVEYYDVDITNKSQVDAAMSKARPQVVFHTASPPPALSDLPLYLKVNVEGTRTLVKSAKEHGTKAFVYTSSASVVHDSFHDLIEADDNSPLLYMPVQREMYSHTKALADQLVLDSNAPGTMLTACIRPSGIFGERDPSAQRFADSAKAGKLKVQIGNGQNLFDWTFNENVIHAHFLAAQKLLESFEKEPPPELRVGGEGFLITNDQHITFWEFARQIGDAAGYPTDREKVRSLPRGLMLGLAIATEWWIWLSSFGRKTSSMESLAIRYSTMTRTYNIAKAKRVLGYKPIVSLPDAIRRAGGSFKEEKKTV